MLGDFLIAEKDDRDLVIVFRAQGGVAVDVDLAKLEAEFAKQGRHL